MRIFLSTLFYFLFICNVFADSPLTTISYWTSVEDAFVLSIGNKPGKKKLTKKMISYFNNPDIDTFNKLALINAIGWEFQSKISNADVYLKSIIKKNKKIYKPIVKSYKDSEMDEFSKEMIVDEFFAKLKNNESTLLYAYLKAMDNYTNVTFPIDLLLTNKNSNNNLFIFNLLQMQNATLKMEFREVVDLFDEYIAECITDKNILNVLPTFNKYIGIYRSSIYYKNTTPIYLDKICNLNTYYINPKQEIRVVNYPVFVYGTLTVFDENNDVIEEKIIDGDDYAELNPMNYKKGAYIVNLKDNKTLKKYRIKLIIE